MRDQPSERRAPRRVGDQPQARTCGSGHQRRGRGREDEGAAAVDEEVAQRRRQAQQRPLAPQRLAAGVQRGDVVAPVQRAAEPLAAVAEHAGRVRLVDQQERVVAIRQRGEIGERRAVAVHPVQALDRDPDAAGAASRAPPEDRVVGRADVVVREAPGLGTTEPHAVVRAGVDQRVVEDEVATLRQGREGDEVGGKSRRQEQRRLAAEERRGLRFQCLVLGMIAAQEPRPARADRHAARQRLDDRLPQRGRLRQSEIVVGREVYARAGTKRA